MSDKPWFHSRVVRGARDHQQSIHVVMRDGSVQTLDAIAVVFANKDVALMIQPIDPEPDETMASAMLVSLDDVTGMHAGIVINPGAANVVLVHAKARE